MPLAGTEAKRDESKLEAFPAAPRGEAGYETRAKQRSEGLPLSAAPAGKALAKKKETGIRLTLAVQDIDAARSAIEKSLAELGGRIIKADSQENKILLTAELSSNQQDRLLNDLKALGEVKGEVAGLEAKEGTITIIRIEILGRPIE
jgi:flagellin-like hook-associated protein FlgL